MFVCIIHFRSQTPEYPGVVEFGEERWASNRDDEEIDESASSRPVEQLHYQNVQGGEIRNHGVGYFAFSTDTEKRKEQMAMLNDLREKVSEDLGGKKLTFLYVFTLSTHVGLNFN